MDIAQPAEVTRRATTLLGEGRPRETLDLVGAALRESPGSAELWHVLGVALATSGLNEQAVEALERAVHLEPTHTEARRNLAGIYGRLGRAGDQRRHLDLALAVARGRLENEPEDPEAWLHLGLSYEANHRVGDALDCFLKAAQSGWSDARLSGALARVGPPAYLEPTRVDPLSGRRLRRIRPTQAQEYIYVVEVSGVCNLKCPSCPTGALSNRGRANGLMTAEMFRSIVDKILVESPSGSKSHLWFFNWGEPLLNPDLPEMIRYAREHGLETMVSSNLNHGRGLEEMVAAGPSTLKLSISGFTEETYSRTHRRGNLEKLKANMQKLSELVERSPYSTQVWVGQHVYRTNQPDLAVLAESCRQLGFRHTPMPAAILSLEGTIDLFHGRGSPDETATDALLLTPTAERVARGLETADFASDCELRYNMTSINPDGTVALCCGVWAPENMLGVSFLEHSHAELTELKYRHHFCATCYAHGLAYVPRTEADPTRLDPPPEPPPKLVQLRPTRRKG
ncbi:MAG: radical SAM protein [Myxococcota bacterium]